MTKKKLGFVAAPDMVRTVNEQCKQRGITVSELLREAVTRHIGLGDVLVSKDLQIDDLGDKLHDESVKVSNLQNELSILKSRGFWDRVFNKGVESND